jgi:hypothetical protein
MTPNTHLTWMFASALLALSTAASAQAPTATFSRFNDAVAGRCYEPASTAPDVANPNLLRVGMVGCAVSSPNGSATVLMDTMSFRVKAPEGHYVSKITFTQSQTASGSRGGSGHASTSWVIDKTPRTGQGVVDLSLERKTDFQVSITTFLAAYGIQVVSGSASASNPQVLVELAPLE